MKTSNGDDQQAAELFRFFNLLCYQEEVGKTSLSQQNSECKSSREDSGEWISSPHQAAVQPDDKSRNDATSKFDETEAAYCFSE